MSCVDEHYNGNILLTMDKEFDSNNKNIKTTFDIWQKEDLNISTITNDDLEINSYILSLSDFSIAKEYAARHKFKDIFVKYKDQYYKTLNNVRFIIETTIDNNITKIS